MKEENGERTSEVNEPENKTDRGREEVYSKVVRAGNRTYFFDVKATRKEDLYLTITESKKRYNKDGKFFFEKHKLFLYKEDFDKFIDGIEDTIGFIKKELSEKQENPEADNTGEKTDSVPADEFVNVDFEDLGEE
ncbi:MAG: PUR family DNA/RNA-binding protein [Bacteroidales bacterium]|nr:PUR family DNA/RNA-binding protein [Bacteroidales bacterium]